MKKNTKVIEIIVCLILGAMVLGVSSYAQTSVKKYKVRDRSRENPPVITPASRFGESPSDAIILFDGKDLSE